MKNPLNNTKITLVLIAVLLITSVSILLTNISVQAQGTGGVEEGGSIPLPAGVTPSFEVDTKAYLSFRPNPVGVNQEILVNIWLEPPTHVVRYHSDLEVIVTNPSGQETEVHIATYRGDSTAWFPWIVDQVGTWTIQFIFPGSYFPAGDYQAYSGGASVEGGTIHFEEDCYYKPTSTQVQELVVQEDIVYSWPASELPTDYWTRPISFVNREWYSIAGNYPWHGPGVGSDWPADTNRFYSDRYDFLPYREAPETSHIVWRRQGEIGGVVGGEARRGSDIPMFQMTGDPGTPTIIYAGRCYQTVTKVRPDGTTGSVWQCYDLRTGEIYWEKTDVDGIPNAIEYDEGSGEVPGGSGRAFGDIGYVNLIYIGGGRLKKYNPFSGALTMDVEIPGGLSSGTYYRNCYALSVQELGDEENPEYRLINWTTAGAPGRNRYPLVISNTTYARSSFGGRGDIYDVESGYGITYSSIVPPQMGATYGTRINGFNLWTGEQTWEVELPTEGMYSGSVAVADHGKVAILFKGGYFKAWDLATGNLAWTSDLMEYPWGEASFGGYSIQSAYGMFYRESYDGVYAFDWDTGDIIWHYIDPASSAYETPYRNEEGTTMYSFDSNAWIADGKLYTINNEHTPTPPITRGWGVNCIDIFTGERVWKLEGPWVWAGPGAIADGYLTITSNEGYMYVFGKGESETTVMGPLTSVPKGTGILITGSVLDMSPDPVLSGTPCVSADSMSTQMQYLFFQYPIDGIWHDEIITGVPVSITAIAEDGTYVDLGTVTTDGFSGTFGKSWIPEKEGTYKVIVAFAGDDSYGSSSATTWVTVGPAGAAGGIIEPEHPIISTEVAIIIAVVAVAVIAAVAYLGLRKRK